VQATGSWDAKELADIYRLVASPLTCSVITQSRSTDIMLHHTNHKQPQIAVPVSQVKKMGNTQHNRLRSDQLY
jgi:hypothetical protein